MRKLLISVLLVASCSAPIVKEDTNFVIPEKKDEFRVISPEAKWGSTYFHHINEQANQFQLTDMRAKALPEGDLKVRVWLGWGLAAFPQGFILNRTEGKWSATHLNPPVRNQPEIKLKAPKSGWGNAWQKLIDAGLLTLPDQEELNCFIPSFDGRSYVVEYNLNDTYRTYKYSEDIYPLCEEAEQMLEIRNIIAEEFGIWSKIKLRQPPSEFRKYFNSLKENMKRERGN